MARKAFVFGSNGSIESGALKYAESDADAMASCLSSNRCAFEVFRASTNADPYQVRQILDSAASACNREDTFLCYFAGHGLLEESGELFIVLENTGNNKLQTTALAADDILASIRRCKATNRLLILDCCHAGGAIGYRDSGTIPLSELSLASANHLILVASGRLERVRESTDLGGSFLTQKIVSALGEDFHRADLDSDLRLTLDELMAYLEQQAGWHNRYQDGESAVPIPYLFGEKKGPFFLTPEDVNWVPYEIGWPDGTTMVVLPIPPVLAEGSTRYRFSRKTSKITQTGFAFAIAKNLITNRQYKNFVESGGPSSPWPEARFYKMVDTSPREPAGERYRGGIWEKGFFPWRDLEFSDPEKPVVCVSFLDALLYARWTDELARAVLPETHTNVVPYKLWQYATFGSPYLSHDPKNWTSDSIKKHQKSQSPAPVDRNGSRANKLGVSDLLGNVWEWCGSMNGFLQRAGLPHTEGVTEEVGLRGGGFLDDIAKIRPFLSEREIPERRTSVHFDHGFRLAALIPFGTLPPEIQQHINLYPPIEFAEQIEIPPLLEGNDF